MKYGPPKAVYRLKQKYNEYSTSFLRPSTNVYGKFKDLFRGLVVVNDITPEVEAKLKDLVQQVKYRADVKILYLTLAVSGDMFELQVVPTDSLGEESHRLYELQRENTPENIASFIERSIENKKNQILQAANMANSNSNSNTNSSVMYVFLQYTISFFCSLPLPFPLKLKEKILGRKLFSLTVFFTEKVLRFFANPISI